MAASSTFQERLQQMEATRTQRLVLLQAEKELQLARSQLLLNKYEDLRRAERRCLLLEQRNAELAHQILASKTQIGAIDARYQAAVCEYRLLNIDIGELQQTEKERDIFYDERREEMKDFEERMTIFVSDTNEEVRKLRDSVSGLKSTLKHQQGNDGYLKNASIAVAEARNSDLLAEKEKLDKNLALSCHFRAVLQKQVQKMLISKEGKKLTSSKDEAKK